MDGHTRISRRATLAKLGGLVAGALAVGGLKAADSLSAPDDAAFGEGPAGVASGAVTCVLAPEQTEGPYYLDDASVRRNITEGKAGSPPVTPTFGRRCVELQAAQRRHSGCLALRCGWGVLVMVHIGGNVVHTGQLYFADAVTDAVYRRSPYSRRPNRDPRNAGDSIYRNGGKRSTLKLARSGSGYTGAITMGVVRA